MVTALADTPTDTLTDNALWTGTYDADLARQLRGVAMAASRPIKKNKHGWNVPSQSGNGYYHVSEALDFCSCPDFALRDMPCKHIYAVRLHIIRELDGDVAQVDSTYPALAMACTGPVPDSAVKQKVTARKPKPKAPTTPVTLMDGPSIDDTPLVSVGNNGLVAAPEPQVLLPPDGDYKLEVEDADRIIIPQGGSLRDWSAYNRAQEMERHNFGAILHDLCRNIPARERGRGPTGWEMEKVVANIARKVYLTSAWRRSVSKEQLELEDKAREAPAWSSLARHLKDDRLTPILMHLIELSSSPFRAIEDTIAVDGTGFATSVKQNWNEYKYGHETRSKGRVKDEDRERNQPEKKAMYVKTHIACGVRTNIVTAVLATAHETGDSPQLPQLINTTAQRFKIKHVVADKAYLALPNLQAAHAVGAEAIIPMKINSVPHEGEDEGTVLWNNLYHFFGGKRQEFLAIYHQRSNVETTIMMVKTKFSEHVRSRHPRARVNEVLVKILCHNICQINRLVNEWGVPDFAWN